jgi:hypothetical protein
LEACAQDIQEAKEVIRGVLRDKLAAQGLSVTAEDLG